MANYDLYVDAFSSVFGSKTFEKMLKKVPKRDRNRVCRVLYDKVRFSLQYIGEINRFYVMHSNQSNEQCAVNQFLYVDNNKPFYACDLVDNESLMGEFYAFLTQDDEGLYITTAVAYSEIGVCISADQLEVLDKFRLPNKDGITDEYFKIMKKDYAICDFGSENRTSILGHEYKDDPEIHLSNRSDEHAPVYTFSHIEE